MFRWWFCGVSFGSRLGVVRMEAVTQEAVIIGPHREALLGPERGDFGKNVFVVASSNNPLTGPTILVGTWT